MLSVWLEKMPEAVQEPRTNERHDLCSETAPQFDIRNGENHK